MDPKPLDDQNQNPEKAPRKRRAGCLIRAVFLILALGVFALSVLTGLVWVQVSRPLAESPRFKPSPAVLAVLKKGNGSAQPQQSATGVLPARAAVASTTATAQAFFELIPERELAGAELKGQARRFNESFRQWAGLMELLYTQGWVKFKELPQAKDQPFGPYPQYGFWQLEAELKKTTLDAAYRQRLNDTCLQMLIYYGDWETASDLCWSHAGDYSWEETLYALRQIPKPLVKYPRIVVWSGLRLIDLAALQRANAQKKRVTSP